MNNIPKKYKNQLDSIKNVLKNPKNKFFFVAGHIRPDGDSVGGCLAVYSLLRRLKKDVSLFSSDTVPSFLKFLPNSSKIETLNDKLSTTKFDVAIVIECAELSRFSDTINPKTHSKITINIDHHPCDKKWADINWTDPSSPSVSEMLFYLFKFLKLPLTKEEAVSLYTGIVTDTHNFTQLNTTAQSHIIAAELMQCGVEPAKVEKCVYGTKSANGFHLLGIALNRVKTDASEKIAYIVITKNDLVKTKTSSEDVEGFVNYAGMVPDVLVWLLFKPSDKNGFVKVSLRSRGEVDVNEIAHIYGGGGHKSAAGCTVKGAMKDVVDTVLSVVKKRLRSSWTRGVVVV